MLKAGHDPCGHDHEALLPRPMSKSCCTWKANVKRDMQEDLQFQKLVRENQKKRIKDLTKMPDASAVAARN